MPSVYLAKTREALHDSHEIGFNTSIMNIGDATAPDCMLDTDSIAAKQSFGVES